MAGHTIITEAESIHLAVLLRHDAAKIRESAKLMDTIADILNPPPSLPEPNRASHNS